MLALYTRSICPGLGKAAEHSHLVAASVTCLQLWIEFLMRFLPDRATVEEVLRAFQGAVLEFLITGNREPGGER